MNPVVHFEMPYDDRQRMAQFYALAFGWQTQLLDENMGNYVLPRPRKPMSKAPNNPVRLTAAFFRKSLIGRRNTQPSLLRWTISTTLSGESQRRAARSSVSR